MSNAVTDAISEPHVIDWDNLGIVPIAEENIGSAAALMDEDATYEFLGLRAEDERAEREKIEHYGKQATKAQKRTAKSLSCVFGRGARQRAHGSNLHGKLPLPCALYNNAR
jgi:hypothetical protein